MIFQALWETKFTKYTSVGVCVDASIYLVSDPRGCIPLPWAFSPSAITGVSSFLRPTPQASKNLCDKGQRMEPFLQKAGPVPYSATIALWLQRVNNCLKRRNEFMAYVTDSPRMGQLRVWLDSGVKPIPRACFWSSLSLQSSMLVSVLALFVESWQQKLYPQFPLRILFLSRNFRSWYCLAPLIWLGSDLGECSMLGYLPPQPKTRGLRGLEFPP